MVKKLNIFLPILFSFIGIITIVGGLYHLKFYHYVSFYAPYVPFTFLVINMLSFIKFKEKIFLLFNVYTLSYFLVTYGIERYGSIADSSFIYNFIYIVMFIGYISLGISFDMIIHSITRSLDHYKIDFLSVLRLLIVIFFVSGFFINSRIFLGYLYIFYLIFPLLYFFFFFSYSQNDFTNAMVFKFGLIVIIFIIIAFLKILQIEARSLFFVLETTKFYFLHEFIKE